MFALYVVAYLDRVNVGFAALAMNRDLGFTATVYGLGAGLFFVSYTAFEIPSNLLLVRVGVRYWIARIMISWGIASAAMMFVSGAWSFYALRFVLGAAEAGFFPGLLLYLTQWFPAAERARAVALFMTATALSGVIGAPMSGALLALDGWLGLAGWQWLFLLEGLPAIAFGVAVPFVLPDSPAEARWLTAAERQWMAERVVAEHAQATSAVHSHFGRALREPRLWQLAALYFVIVVSLYSVSFWLPQILQALSGAGAVQVALVSAVPYLAASIAMVIVGISSDRTRERRWHIALSAVAGSIGLAAAGVTASPIVGLAMLSLAAAGIWSTLGPFWTLPPEFLRGMAAAGGIALINSVGNIGGFLGPYLMGFVKDQTGRFAAGLYVLAGTLVVGAGIALATRGERERRIVE